MVKRYYLKDITPIRKYVDIIECPDCGFEYNAMHEVDEQVGGWECPLCEVDELKQEIKKLKQKPNKPVGIKCNSCGKMHYYTTMCPYCDEGRKGN